MRILSKGSSIPFVHESVGWDESTNFKDYDIVFVNLRTLEQSAHEYDHPYNESEDSPTLFMKSDIRTFLEENGHMIVYLPQSLTVEMGGETTQPKGSTATKGGYLQQSGKPSEPDPYSDYHLLDWLPFGTHSDTSEEGSSVELLDNDWGWYFGKYFEWEK